MKRKINLRLVGIAVLAVLATVAGITLIYYGLFQKQVHAELSVSAKLLKDTHYFESEYTDEIDLSTGIDELRVTWVAEDGTVLYDNDVTVNTLTNHFDRPEIQDAFKHGVGETIRRSDTLNKNTYYYAVLLDNGTVLRVAVDAQSLWSVFVSAAPLIILIILLVIAICVAISHILTKQLLRPIEWMVENLDNADCDAPYRELEPLTVKLRAQHTDILSAAKARQDFTANVSHELKTPLTAISGYAELLAGGIAAEDQRQHFYQEIRRNADRLLSLINDIIKLSELDRKGKLPAFEELNLCDVVGECLEELKVNARQKEITLTYSGEKCSVRGNKELLKELVENLAQNAIRYNNPGGLVRITVGKKDGHPLLMVEDNGIGIPLSEQARVFERFYRVDKSRSKATGGTGLGLAIVKHIVEIHDASIDLKSEPGRGTDIAVRF